MEMFFGREHELNQLAELLDRKIASLVIVMGRRRIGKSTLIEKFGERIEMLTFAGLAPTEKVTAQDQRNEFSNQMRLQGLPGLKSEDWTDLFFMLGEQVQNKRVLILFDEVSWMGSKDATFLSKLKNAWDLYFKKNNKLILVLCSSISTWMEKNILRSTGFLGRPTLTIDLHELPLSVSEKFFMDGNKSLSAYEKLKLLAITGGIPRYLELINPKLTAEDNIKRLCFTHKGILVDEFENIFTDIFTKRNRIYKQIITRLADGGANQDQICEYLKIKKTGKISKYLNSLIRAGFVSKDQTWHLHNGKVSPLSHYRLKDNYLRFYIKYIEPNLPKIEIGLFAEQTLTALPAWNSIMGLQFENLVVNNRSQLKRLLGINPNDVIFDNPFFQRKTNRQKGCQIDYLIQLKTSNIYICEVKFKRGLITNEAIVEVQEKINRIKLPKHMSYRSVLIHVNGVHEDVIDSGFFTKIVDFGEMLKSN